MKDCGKQSPVLMYFVNLVSVATLSVGVEGCLSRLLPDESLWGSSEKKREGGTVACQIM